MCLLHTDSYGIPPRDIHCVYHQIIACINVLFFTDWPWKALTFNNCSLLDAKNVDHMIINATDITTMTTAKPKVTPIISATLPFSIEVCSVFCNSASAVNSIEFFSLGVDAVVVCLNSLSSGVMPENAKRRSKQLEVQSRSVLKLFLRDSNHNLICTPNHLKQ